MSRDEKGYNGWKNYETWAVNLWLTNDQGSQEMIDEMTARAAKSKSPKNELADALKSTIQEDTPELPGMYADLLGAAISEIDFWELSETYLKDYAENNPEEEPETEE